MWLPCRKLPSISLGHTILVPSSLLAAQPQMLCEHYKESLCVLVQPAYLPSPRRAGEKRSLALWPHAGLGTTRVKLALIMTQ